MPPVGTTPQQYLTRMLAALIVQNGGELRIKSKFMREVMRESERQAIFEDTDAKKDEIVLRFGSKDSTLYAIEPECRANGQPEPKVRTQPQTAATIPAEPAPQGRLALTDQDLANMEVKIRKIRVASQMKRQASQNPTPNM